MAKLTLLEDMALDELSYEEIQAYNKLPPGGGVISSRTIPYVELSDEDLEAIFQYDPANLEFIMRIRKDFIQRCHPEVLN